eukprot:gb/GECG01012690.1/.p1 GENE.gb/GECG01012690.1/~~gb/GECG01012690.1/.p1  ORF type:complete len:112 (+),score=16.76 gb/GECG01012690.1/:1-336(+)
MRRESVCCVLVRMGSQAQMTASRLCTQTSFEEQYTDVLREEKEHIIRSYWIPSQSGCTTIFVYADTLHKAATDARTLIDLLKDQEESPSASTVSEKEEHPDTRVHPLCMQV